KTLFLGLQPGDLLLRQDGQLRAGWLGRERPAVRGEFLDALEVAVAGGDQRFEPGVLARKLLRALRVVEYARVTERGFDFGTSLLELCNVRAEVHAKSIQGPVLSRSSPKSPGGTWLCRTRNTK